MKKGLLFILLALSTGVKADQLADEYYQGRVDGLWDVAVGFCIDRKADDLAKCAEENYKVLERWSNKVVIND